MEKVELPIHEHPLLPITRFSLNDCKGCGFEGYIYGGYRCNELGCDSVIHRECAEPFPEINHSSHPDHPLKLFQGDRTTAACSLCGNQFENGYICSICHDFKLDLRCAKEPAQILENFNLHQHPLEFLFSVDTWFCETCDNRVYHEEPCYKCYQCDLVFHVECAKFFPEANHTSHPQHPLKVVTFAKTPNYPDENCLLCGVKFYGDYEKLHHCDVCNFSICTTCMKNPPPVAVESPTTHEHQLHLVPRCINFTCNACGTIGDRSPYFCLQCNFMIHRECIDLPRVININRHDHRISYTPRLGHGEGKCKVCREKVDGFYGAYTCVKCPSFSVHPRCATRKDIWDMIELEGTPDEEEEVAPFEVIDANTIKHVSHEHNLLGVNKDGHDRILPENIVCKACRLQILSEPSYICEQCDFILHEKCANHPLKKRHVLWNLPFKLLTDSRHEVDACMLCRKQFSGFRYISSSFSIDVIIDVRCAAISDTLEHGSHQHPLYYYGASNDYKPCSRCGHKVRYFYRCDECNYTLDIECAQFPKKVMRNRYDDHPLFLSYGDMDVDGLYWCEACERKLDPKEWFYTCIDCGTVLHISCVVGDFSYIMPGSHLDSREKVVSNTSICRPICAGRCKSRCVPPSILKISRARFYYHVCSYGCRY